MGLMSKTETLWRQRDALSGQLQPLWAQRKAIEKRLLDGAGNAWADMDREETLDKRIRPLQEQQSDVDSESNTLLSKLADIVRLADAGKMDKLETLRTHAAIARARFDNSPTAEDYLAEFFPIPTQKTLTDADGRFSFSFPRHKSFTIFATAKRAVMDSTERYYWLVNAPTDPQMGQVFLSNNNLVFADPDGYFKLKPKEVP